MKIVLKLFIFIFMLTISSAVYAGSDEDATQVKNILNNIQKENNNILKITNGLSKEYEATFDKTRIISGKAKRGTYLTIYVYTKNGEYIDVKQKYEKVIGLSGRFNQMIDLDMDKNYILVVAYYKDFQVSKQVCINRKDIWIKSSLEEKPQIFEKDISVENFSNFFTK